MEEAANYWPLYAQDLTEGTSSIRQLTIDPQIGVNAAEIWNPSVGFAEGLVSHSSATQTLKYSTKNIWSNQVNWLDLDHR